MRKICSYLYSITNFIVSRTMSCENPCSSLPNFNCHITLRHSQKTEQDVMDCTRYDKKPKLLSIV